MRKTESLTWEQVYDSWRIFASRVPESLQELPPLQEIHVSYNRNGVFYGYDWLHQEACEDRKRLLETNPAAFLLSTRSTNKGTIHTLQMLQEAKDEEEQAAIWLCASTKEMMQTARGSAYCLAGDIHAVCWTFLKDRFCMWQHAMKGLVPRNYIPYSLLVETDYTTPEAIIDLARMNMAFVNHEYVPVLYTSLNPGDLPPDISVRYG